MIEPEDRNSERIELSGEDHTPLIKPTPQEECSDLFKDVERLQTFDVELNDLNLNVELSPEVEKSASCPKINWEFIKDSYVEKKVTIAIGLTASCISLPVSWGIGYLLDFTDIPETAAGLVSMGGAMFVWDILYSAGLYKFYDKKELNEIKEEELKTETWRGQLKNYAFHCLNADLIWATSYQVFYLVGLTEFQLSIKAAAGTAHVASILCVDLLRPPFLKYKETLLEDQKNK